MRGKPGKVLLAGRKEKSKKIKLFPRLLQHANEALLTSRVFSFFLSHLTSHEKKKKKDPEFPLSVSFCCNNGDYGAGS